jgi:hypothetical protein
MKPLSQVSEREERESSTREYRPFKVPREALQPRAWSIYYPFPLLAVMGKTRTSRTVRDALADCPHLNSNGKIAKSTAGRTDRWAGRTVRQDPADCPLGPTDCPRAVHRAAPCSVKNNRLSAWKRIFSKTFAKKLRY